METTNPRYIMIGGFLGSGKTTAVMQLAKRLTRMNKSTGLIANDQSIGLVDSALMKTTGLPVEEIAGGCFCCKFNSLIDATQRLSKDSIPEFFVAEPVGSCTDLIATVSYPLRRLYGDDYTIAPLSVLVDPIRARRVMGLDTTRSFSDKVIYIYKKQLEEADYIIINKQELLDDSQNLELKEALMKEFSPRDVLFCSARIGEGLDEWFERLFNEEIGNKQPMALDYDVYADG
ncbi:cobalamin biosynthesis protein P47K, partial [bacterium]|nr:cobalamin biosynthesis protein P47K [bacterium]